MNDGCLQRLYGGRHIAKPLSPRNQPQGAVEWLVLAFDVSVYAKSVEFNEQRLNAPTVIGEPDNRVLLFDFSYPLGDVGVVDATARWRLQPSFIRARPDVIWGGISLGMLNDKSRWTPVP